MAISITHKFVSSKADGGDNTLVRPSNWNDTHTITMATARILGRTSSGTGEAQELTAAQVRALADVPSNADISGFVPTSRTISTGGGLGGGGNLSANRTISVGAGIGITVNAFDIEVKYGTAAGTACEGNDARLTNSREWTGATVSQAEAEAGTATSRRAWTAQRVAQAIAAQTTPSPVGLYTGTSNSNITFPVGHILLAKVPFNMTTAQLPANNQTPDAAYTNGRLIVTVLGGASGLPANSGYSVYPTGTALAGTWRSRGGAFLSDTPSTYDGNRVVYLFQRVA